MVFCDGTKAGAFSCQVESSDGSENAVNQETGAGDLIVSDRIPL
jgi:hypothetical protein